MKVWDGSVSDYGSCNNCQNRKDVDVTIVLLQTICFRLCKKCVKELSEKLKIEIDGNSVPWQKVLPDTQPGKILRGLRNRDDRSLKWVALSIGLKESTIMSIETGEKSVGVSLAKKLGKLFNVSHEIFLLWEMKFK